MVGRWVSFWDGLFSGAMLVLGRVPHKVKGTKLTIRTHARKATGLWTPAIAGRESWPPPARRRPFGAGRTAAITRQTIPRHPNTSWEGIWTPKNVPKTPAQEVFGCLGNVYIILQLASLFFSESYHSHIISKTPSKTATICNVGNTWHHSHCNRTHGTEKHRFPSLPGWLRPTFKQTGMKIPKQKESNPGGGFNPSEKY